MMTSTESQNKQILAFMAAGNSITDATARELFNCSRLGARVYELRQKGVQVLDGWEYKTNDEGKVMKKWKKYWMEEKA